MPHQSGEELRGMSDPLWSHGEQHPPAPPPAAYPVWSPEKYWQCFVWLPFCWLPHLKIHHCPTADDPLHLIRQRVLPFPSSSSSEVCRSSGQTGSDPAEAFCARSCEASWQTQNKPACSLPHNIRLYDLPYRSESLQPPTKATTSSAISDMSLDCRLILPDDSCSKTSFSRFH